MQLYRRHKLYISNSNLKSVVKKLEHNSGLTIASFEINCETNVIYYYREIKRIHVGKTASKYIVKE